jgi:glycyl-tRNA synthetase
VGSTNDVMEKLVSLCKRRGFIFQSSEIYGGLNSCYDYGPLGVELKRNVKDFWWKSMTQGHDNIEGLDSSILMHPKIWEASGHVAGFTDPLVDCKSCKNRFRADQVEGKKCPKCGGELTEARNFNLMFKTFMGPVESEASVVYLRPETAQGIYVNYLNVLNSSRQKVPFGIAQIGKAFRNEITPGNFTFRTREFEQMEMQYFVRAGDDEASMESWKTERIAWYDKLKIKKENLQFHQHGPNELAHYAKSAFDIQYQFPFGWQELEGIHNRTDFDLKRHQEFSGKNLQYFDEERKEKYLPYIIETSAGCDRSILCILCDAFTEEPERIVMKFAPFIAPMQVGVFPLVKKDGLAEIAQDIVGQLRNKFRVFYDESGSIGRRYRRQDEIGTPFGLTVDHESKENQTVTLRDRDTMKQDRIKIADLVKVLEPKLAVPL